MTDRSDIVDLKNSDSLVSFSGRLMGSSAFIELFERGMSLVEEAANYLDGLGRAQSKTLDRPAALAYATESMRLTTRLMQLASWLLLQRAVSEGEMTIEQAKEEQHKVKIKKQPITADDQMWEELPAELRDLIDRSIRLQEHILHFDQALSSVERVEAPSSNPLDGHLNLISQAFAR